MAQIPLHPSNLPSPADDADEHNFVLPLKRKPDDQPQRQDDTHPSQRSQNKVYVVKCCSWYGTDERETSIVGVYQDIWAANTECFNHFEFTNLVEMNACRGDPVEISMDADGSNACASYRCDSGNLECISLEVEEANFSTEIGSRQATLAAKANVEALLDESEEDEEQEDDDNEEENEDDDEERDRYDRYHDPYAEGEDNSDDDSNEDSEENSDSEGSTGSSVQVIE